MFSKGGGKFSKILAEYTPLGHTRSNQELQYEQNNNKNKAAGIFMICLATAAFKQCPGGRIVLFSSDTNVLVLAIAHSNIDAIVSSVVDIRPMWIVLEEEKASAL